MTDLKTLKDAAREYTRGDLNEDGFHEVILAFLHDAAGDDYMAFALWLLEQNGKGH